MGKESNSAASAIGFLMIVVGLTCAFFSWLGFGGISEANDGIRPSPVRIGVTLGMLGLAALGLALMLAFSLRALWLTIRNRKDG